MSILETLFKVVGTVAIGSILLLFAGGLLALAATIIGDIWWP